jgi:hypothetical protein
MKVFNGKLYLATADSAQRCPMYQGYSGFCGRVIEYDGTNWRTVFDHIGSNTREGYLMYSLEVYNGRLYAGTADRIYMSSDGINWQLTFDSTEGAQYAIVMKTWNNKIYVGFGNGVMFKDDLNEPTTTTTTTTTTSTTTTICKIVGDINNDGTVDKTDSDLLQKAFNTRPGDPNWNPDADLNKDGVVDILDAIIIGSNFGKSCPVVTTTTSTTSTTTIPLTTTTTTTSTSTSTSTTTTTTSTTTTTTTTTTSTTTTTTTTTSSTTTTTVPTTTTTTTTTTSTTIPPKPDLIIENISNSGNTINYRIKNQGTAKANSSYSKLWIDNNYKAQDSVPSLAAGSSSNEYFSYTWKCSGTSDIIKICADANGNVIESNETNNCITKTFTCPKK